mmetsp:Transcript_15707/g.38228  ORF Transcript_15707/g.38228 Transcript_15707/m.38228 type:complete len:169 (-) Transcript_15707:25-531(-)
MAWVRVLTGLVVAMCLLTGPAGALEDFQVVYEGHEVVGQRLTRQETARQPGVSAPALGAASTAPHAVLMWDPDAPSPANPTCNAWLHWIYVDATGSHLTHGVTVEPYAPPTPPEGTHTYHIALYRQSLLLGSVSPPSGRCGFDVAAFVQQHGLQLVEERTFTVSADGA